MKKPAKKSKKHVDTSSSEALRFNPFADLVSSPQPDGNSQPDEASKPSQLDAEKPKTPISAAGEKTPLTFPAKLVIQREKKGRAGKTVTRISGLPHEHLAKLMKQMKKALGCGATVEGEDLILLGSLVDRAAEWLEAAGAKKVVRSGA